MSQTTNAVTVPATNPNDQARDDAMAHGAEEDMMLPARSSSALRGSDAAAHGRAALEAALGGPGLSKRP